jgi:heme A synthase
MLGLHIAVGLLLIVLNAAAGLVGGIAWYRNQPSIPFWYLLRAAQGAVFAQALLGGLLVMTGHEQEDGLHYLYGILPLVVSFIAEGARADAAQREVGDPGGRPGSPGAGDRPPRDGDHGRQLRRHLLLGPARRRDQWALLASNLRSDTYEVLDRRVADCFRFSAH